MYSSAQPRPELTIPKFGLNRVNRRGFCPSSFLVTGNSFTHLRGFKLAPQRSILPNFRLKLISSDSRLATPRWLWAAVSFVWIQIFSQSAREARKKIPSTSMGITVGRDLRPLGVSLPLRTCVKQPAPSTSRRYLGSHPARGNAIFLGARWPEFC